MEMEGESKERQPPWLLTSHEQNNDKHYLYDVVENRFRAKSIPELRNKFVCSSSYGWLVLVDYSSGECCIWNPESMDKIELPSLEDPLIYNKCILSKPPTDPHCHVLFISCSGFTRAFCKVGDDEFVVEQVTTWQDLLAATAFRGQIYGLIYSGYRSNQFVTVHFMDKNLEFRPMLIKENEEQQYSSHVPPSWRPYTTGDSIYMMESPCNNELLLVLQWCSYSFINNVFDFRVFALDLHKMECKELESIGNRSIFLSRDGVGVCCSSTTLKGNCIYYTEPNSRNLYIYDFNDRGKTLLLPSPVAKLSQSRTFWIEHHKFVN